MRLGVLSLMFQAGEKGQADVNFKISACHLATQKAVGLRGRDGYHFIFIQTHDV